MSGRHILVNIEHLAKKLTKGVSVGTKRNTATTNTIADDALAGIGKEDALTQK